MAVNVYEGMFIFDSRHYSRDAAGVAGGMQETIEKAGGELLTSRLWEERRLAYSINGQRKGTYWLTYIRIDGRELSDITRQCEINDSILRQLFVKVDPRLVDTLVAHATETAKPAASETSGKSAEGAADAKAADGKAADDKAADDKAADDKAADSTPAEEPQVEPVAAAEGGQEA